eukprot:5464954-Pleurochrysis_carterae.AAC.1
MPCSVEQRTQVNLEKPFVFRYLRHKHGLPGNSSGKCWYRNWVAHGRQPGREKHTGDWSWVHIVAHALARSLIPLLLSHEAQTPSRCLHNISTAVSVKNVEGSKTSGRTRTCATDGLRLQKAVASMAHPPVP